MLTRLGGNLAARAAGPGDGDAAHLEREGWVMLRGVVSPDLRERLSSDIDAAFANDGFDPRDTERYRYQMLNRSAAAQEAVALPAVLDAIEPLLGEDCHVIANTAWRDRPDVAGGPWHCDAGPHIPLADGVRWPDDIAHPVFAVGVHLFLEPCDAESGPTAVVPGSHRSGRLPPRDTDRPTFEGRGPVLLEADAGDAAIFVSDIWHRGMPPGPHSRGRSFQQVHYGRRDIAQRLRPTGLASQLSPEAVARAEAAAAAGDERALTVIGLHRRRFYDG